MCGPLCGSVGVRECMWKTKRGRCVIGRLILVSDNGSWQSRFYWFFGRILGRLRAVNVACMLNVGIDLRLLALRAAWRFAVTGQFPRRQKSQEFCQRPNLSGDSVPLPDRLTQSKKRHLYMASYAHPEVLVSTAWVAEHLNDPGVRIVESDEDLLLYTQGHVPGAVMIDWHTDLQDVLVRDYIGKERFAQLCESKGIGNDTTVVFYGDKNNWWACYAFWVFKLYGHEKCSDYGRGRKKRKPDAREWSREQEANPRNAIHGQGAGRFYSGAFPATKR